MDSDFGCNGRLCRLCYEDEEDIVPSGASSSTMVSPCKCDGSMKWIHRNCLKQWLIISSVKNICEVCGYNYCQAWTLKAPSEWSLPSLKLGLWDFARIFNDFVASFLLFLGYRQCSQDTNYPAFIPLIMAIIFCCWTFQFIVDRRDLLYRSIATSITSTIFEKQFYDYADYAGYAVSKKKQKVIQKLKHK